MIYNIKLKTYHYNLTMPKKVTKESSDESSDDSSNESVYSDNIKCEHMPKPQILPKKRGRPRKTALPPKQVSTKPTPTEKKKQLQNEEIILRLPNYDNDDMVATEKNIFTMRDDSDNKHNVNGILSLSDGNISDSESSDDNSQTSNLKTKNKALLNELKKKDLQIKKLKSSVLENKNNKYVDTIICTTKDLKGKIMNLNLVNIKDNKPIVVDTTDIACWWCTDNFNTLPCFIPDRYTDGKYYVFGCFCTYSCAKAYNSDMRDYRTQLRTALINKLCASIFGPNNQIPIAPSREMHKKFGGVLSSEEFRNGSLLCKKEYKTVIPPLIPLIHTYDEINKEIGGNIKSIEIDVDESEKSTKQKSTVKKPVQKNKK